MPDQIVITDAGSNDGTIQVLESWKQRSKIRITILVEKGCNIARGRNKAIEAADHDLIVSTDFGCRYDSRWLESVVRPFADPEVKVVGGGYGVLEEDIVSLASRANYILSAGYRINFSEWFIPSSRSIAYYREVWEKAGRYPEWLTLAADDLVFGMVLQKMGYKIAVVEAPLVKWGRHKTARAYGKEAYRYGLGDGEAGVNYRQFLSKLAELVFRIAFFLSLIPIVALVATKYLSAPFLLLPLLFVPGFRPYFHAFSNWRILRSSKYNMKTLSYSFYLIELTRVQYIKGYIKGYFLGSSEQKREARKLKQILSS